MTLLPWDKSLPPCFPQGILWFFGYSVIITQLTENCNTEVKRQTKYASLEDGLAKQTTVKLAFDSHYTLSTVSVEP